MKGALPWSPRLTTGNHSRNDSMKDPIQQPAPLSVTFWGVSRTHMVLRQVLSTYRKNTILAHECF